MIVMNAKSDEVIEAVDEQWPQVLLPGSGSSRSHDLARQIVLISWRERGHPKRIMSLPRLALLPIGSHFSVSSLEG
jgi:hypothetical protein